MGMFNHFNPKTRQEQNDANLFSKVEMEGFIHTLLKLSDIFFKSNSLEGGRNVRMMNLMHSYASILGYYYEIEFQYGKFSNIVNDKIELCSVMANADYKKSITEDLADNWSDILQVIFNCQLDSDSTSQKLKDLKNEVENLTKAFETFSKSKCKEPQNPMNVTQKVIIYNPYNITEDIECSKGHSIPIMTHLFTVDLITLQKQSHFSNLSIRDIVVDYAITLVKSYYDSTGFVPMVIIDQITGQVEQASDAVGLSQYVPHRSLKKLVLDKIYKYREKGDEFLQGLIKGDNNPQRGSFIFHSNIQQRYENKHKVAEASFNRDVIVEKNISGEIGYSVSIKNPDVAENSWGATPMGTKPMKIISVEDSKIVLKGYGYDKCAYAFGASLNDASFENYGLTIYHNGETVIHCILHMIDRKVDIDYCIK